MKRHIFGGICQVLFRKKWGDFNYEQRKSLEKSRLRIPRRYFIYRGECINSPLILHSGVNDIEANKEIMQRWSSVTKKVVRMREFQSDHFFVLNLGNEYWEQLYRDLLEE